jgi:hypothetical protein
MINGMTQRAKRKESAQARFLFVLGNVVDVVVPCAFRLATSLALKAIPFADLIFDKLRKSIRVRVGLNSAFPIRIFGSRAFSLMCDRVHFFCFNRMVMTEEAVAFSGVSDAQFYSGSQAERPVSEPLYRLGPIERFLHYFGHLFLVLGIRPSDANGTGFTKPRRSPASDRSIAHFASLFIHVLHPFNDKYTTLARGCQYKEKLIAGGAT